MPLEGNVVDLGFGPTPIIELVDQLLEPLRPFDIRSFMASQINRFFASGGTDLGDETCMHCNAMRVLPEAILGGCADVANVCDREGACAGPLEGMADPPADLACPPLE